MPRNPKQHDFDAFEVPIESRVRRTEEALEQLRRAGATGEE